MLNDPLTQIDILITDDNIEGASTHNLFKQIRNGTLGPNPFLPIIVALTNKDTNVINNMLSSGVNDLVTKPLSAAVINKRVETLLHCEKHYAITDNYIGPDRRPKERLNPEKDVLVKVPNTLKIKINGSKKEKALLQQMIEESKDKINEACVRVNGNSIKMAIEQLISKDSDSIEIKLYYKVLDDMAKELIKKLRNKTHIVNLCEILLQIIVYLKSPTHRENPNISTLLTLVGDTLAKSVENLDQSTVLVNNVVGIIKKNDALHKMLDTA
jgi:DNA-binding response OmpR family regulator